MIALLSSFLPGCFLSKWVIHVLEHRIFPFFPFLLGDEGENRTTDLALHNLTSCRRRHCTLKMLRNKRYSNLRLIKSLSTTFSLTKPDLSFLASNSGTPMRLWVSKFYLRFFGCIALINPSWVFSKWVSFTGSWTWDILLFPVSRWMNARIEPRTSLFIVISRAAVDAIVGIVD